MKTLFKVICLVLIIANIVLFFKVNDEKQVFESDIGKYTASASSDKISAFNRSLPEAKEIINMVNQFTKLGNKHHVTIPETHYSSLITNNGYKNLVFTFSVTGDYANIRRFIYNLETMRKFIYIDSLNLRKGSGDTGLVIELQVSTYFK